MQKVCPLGVAFLTHRLLAFTLHDLRRLATGPIPDTPEEWKGRTYGRLSILPDQAQTVAALAANGGVLGSTQSRSRQSMP
jgi:hypothetical protein